MKKSLTLFLLLTSFTLLFAQAKNKNQKVNYDFTSVDLNGNEISSEIYSKNTITMINIWGTFCGPCIREMPDLAKLSEANKDKGVEIIGIPIDVSDATGRLLPRAKKSADSIIAQTGVTYKNVVPNHQMLSGFLRDVIAVPTSIFIDKNGNQIGEIYMGSRSQKDWQLIIDKLLKSQSHLN